MLDLFLLNIFNNCRIIKSVLKELDSHLRELVPHHHLGNIRVRLHAQRVGGGVIPVPQRDVGGDDPEELSECLVLKWQTLMRSPVIPNKLTSWKLFSSAFSPLSDPVELSRL